MTSDSFASLRAAVTQAVAELDAEHRPDLPDNVGPRGGCVMCWPKDGSWPCISRQIADDLRRLLGDSPPLQAP